MRVSNIAVTARPGSLKPSYRNRRTLVPRIYLTAEEPVPCIYAQPPTLFQRCDYVSGASDLVGAYLICKGPWLLVVSGL